MAGMVKTCAIENIFRNRIGNESTRMTCAHQLNTMFDGFECSRCIRTIRLAGLAFHPIL